MEKKSKIKHNLSRSRIYHKYYAIKKRCYNHNAIDYKYYGGKGVKMCDEWLNDFMNFYNWSMQNGYSEELTIDRIDPSKDYSPENCRYTPRSVQAKNRNKSMNPKTSKYLHVSFWEKQQAYCVSIFCDGSRYVYNGFSNDVEAAKYADHYIISHNLSNLYQLNFPDYDYTNYVPKHKKLYTYNILKYDVGITKFTKDGCCSIRFEYDKKRIALTGFKTREEALHARVEYILKINKNAKFM